MTTIEVSLVTTRENSEETFARCFGLMEAALDHLYNLVSPSLTENRPVVVVPGSIMSENPNLEEYIQTINGRKDFEVVFIEESGGPSYQTGKFCFVYIMHSNGMYLSDTSLLFEIAHELCHAFGCCHYDTGIMSGSCNEFPDEDLDLSLDDKSLKILSLGPLVCQRINEDVEFEYKIEDGHVLARCSEPVSIVIFKCGGMYDELFECDGETNEFSIEPCLSSGFTFITMSGYIFTLDLPAEHDLDL